MTGNSGLKTINNLLERIDSLQDTQTCIEDISSTLNIDFVTYHLAVHNTFLYNSIYIKTNYPAEWVRQYFIRNYSAVDPVLKNAYTGASPGLMSDLDWDDPKVVPFKEDAALHGIPDSGYFIPISDRQGRRAVMKFCSSDGQDLWTKKVSQLSTVLNKCALIVHDMAVADIQGSNDNRSLLSPRERECLFWVAHGKDAISIGKILGISEHTVREYCKSAKRKLDATTLYQAIHRATLLHLIN